MGKLLLLSLALVLCLLVSTLGRVIESRRGRKAKRNNTQVGFPGPRTFRAEKSVTPNTSCPLLKGTQAPISSLNPPVLLLLSNSTARYLQGPLSTKFIPVIYISVITVGIPANTAILCLLATKIRKVSSAILYCSLALSDLLLLLSLTFKAHYHLHGNRWGLGEAACRLVTACFYGNLYCSAQTLACISVKRYLAVVHPFLYKRLPKKTWSAWAVLVVWGVYGVALVPELLVQQSYRISQLGIITCHDVLPLQYSSHKFLLYYNLALTCLGFLLPLVVVAVSYIGLIRELSRLHRDWAMYMKASSLVLVIFLLCFTPAGMLHFAHYVQLFVDGTEVLYVYYNIAVCLCCLHSCLDPFLFQLMSKSTGSSLYFKGIMGKLHGTSGPCRLNARYKKTCC